MYNIYSARARYHLNTYKQAFKFLHNIGLSSVTRRMIAAQEGSKSKAAIDDNLTNKIMRIFSRHNSTLRDDGAARKSHENRDAMSISGNRARARLEPSRASPRLDISRRGRKRGAINFRPRRPRE